MRVITGLAKGRRLKSPPGKNTRPITGRIKEALFSVIGADIEDSCFLDLFAGSGSVGIEAFSRGAAEVVFVENNSKAVMIIYENLGNCGFKNRFTVLDQDALSAVTGLDKRKAKFDYVYIDPPFTLEGIFIRIMKKVDEADILNQSSSVIIRTPRNLELPTALSRLSKYRHNYYGESALHYYLLMP